MINSQFFEILTPPYLMKTHAHFHIVFFLCICSIISEAQNLSNDSFGKGLTVTARDSSFCLKFGFRFQTLYIGEQNLESKTYEDRFLTRRSRLKFEGFAHNPDIEYKVELGLSNRDLSSGHIDESGNTANIILDAVAKWQFARGWTVWFGQTKLPGNRERVISSQKLQFVDRSLVNSGFNLDRDLGIQLHHKGKFGNGVSKQAIALSMGEGRNIISANPGGGHQLTGRIELLPLGEFTGKGDYFGSDLKREPEPRISIGITGDMNYSAVRQRGNLGSFNTDSLGNYIESDIATFLADMMYKHRGFSVMSEYAYRTTSNNAGSNFGAGQGFVIQSGYLFESKWELAGRYTVIDPAGNSSLSAVSEYTVGISRYVVDHSLKIQGDISYADYTNEDDEMIYRFQVEVAF